MDSRSGIVTLLSDFGVRDSYVAAMKGKIFSVETGLKVVDITHHISQGDVRSGAYVLSQAAFCFPKGTVHCAVVDPGVGSARAAIVLKAAGHFFVGPDNGLLSDVMKKGQGFQVRRVEVFQVRGPQTFHGRDLFAPVAARIAAGVAIEEVGPQHEGPVASLDKAPRVESGVLKGDVVYVDGFGNLITNIAPSHLVELGVNVEAGKGTEGIVVEVREEKIGGVSRTFSEVASGELVSYFGSAGTLEVAVRDGSATEVVGAIRGDGVRCRRN